MLGTLLSTTYVANLTSIQFDLLQVHTKYQIILQQFVKLFKIEKKTLFFEYFHFPKENIFFKTFLKFQGFTWQLELQFNFQLPKTGAGLGSCQKQRSARIEPEEP